jgi:hypothetical protein
VSKLGKRDLFAPTLEHHASAQHLRELPASSLEDVEKVMVMLTSRQITALDEVCLEIRQTTGVKFKRSMLIRSLIDAFLQSPPSFRNARSHEDIARQIMGYCGRAEER